MLNKIMRAKSLSLEENFNKCLLLLVSFYFRDNRNGSLAQLLFVIISTVQAISQHRHS